MERKEKYVGNVEGKCPKCGYEYLTYTHDGIDGGFLLCYHWYCKNCDARGIEYYQLTFVGHSVHDDNLEELDNVNDYLNPGSEYDDNDYCYYPKEVSYIIIDQMEKEIYHFNDDISLGFGLDRITAERDRLEIPYKVHYYNNGKIISIRPARSRLIEDYLLDD